MTIEEIREIQKALMNSVFFTETWFYQFSSLRPNHTLFGQYQELAKIALIAKTPNELELSKISTEIITRGLNKVYTDIMDAEFSIPNFYRDIKILIKEAMTDTSLDSIVQLQEDFRKVDEAKAKEQSKSYTIRNMFDDMYADLTEKSDRKSEGKTLWYSTGFPLLDRYTEGIQKGTVTRLNAYSNVWKSKFSYQIVNKILDQWAHVVFFSLEVTKHTILYNLIANRYRMPISWVYRMEFDNVDFWKLFTKKLEIVDDKYTLYEILQYAEIRKPDVIVIDFVQNIRSDGKSEYERMTNIAVEIQQLAIKNNIAVFDLSQISNDGTKYTQGDAIPSKWSGALVASADVGLVLKKEKDDPNKIILHIAKNKFGQNGKSIDYKVDFAKWLFFEIGESKSSAF